MKKNNRFFISFLISLLLHGLIFGLLVFLKPQQPQKQTQVKLDNLLVLKRGYSQDKSKNTPGARKPSIAAKSIQPSPLITPNQNPLAKASTPPKAQQKKQKDTDKKALDSYNPSSFDARNLSLLDPSPSYMQNSTPQSATQIDKGTDPQTIQEIDKLYGEEFGDLGSAEKDFIRNNLRNIGRITQRYLSYPRLASYFEQSGVNSVEFSLKDPQSYKDKVLVQAINDAKRKADIIAKTLGKNVVNVVSVNSNNSYIEARTFNSMMYAKAADSAAVGASSPIQAGDISVKANVSIVFEIN